MLMMPTFFWMSLFTSAADAHDAGVRGEVTKALSLKQANCMVCSVSCVRCLLRARAVFAISRMIDRSQLTSGAYKATRT